MDKAYYKAWCIKTGCYFMAKYSYYLVLQPVFSEIRSLTLCFHFNCTVKSS